MAEIATLYPGERFMWAAPSEETRNRQAERAALSSSKFERRGGRLHKKLTGKRAIEHAARREFLRRLKLCAGAGFG